MRSRAEASKRRFLESLWRAQALYRTRGGGSVALVSEEQEVEARGVKVQIARTYWNVYQRTMFLKEIRKVGCMHQLIRRLEIDRKYLIVQGRPAHRLGRKRRPPSVRRQ
jgi:hypothetical protein